MLDLLRRVAALTVVSAVGIGLLAPLTAGTTFPEELEADSLLDLADRPDSVLPRGPAGRELAADLTLARAEEPIAPETLAVADPLPKPASVSMEATLYLAPTPATPPPTVPPPPPSGDVVRGAATWYCCSDGYRGEAVVALPGALGGQYDPPPAGRYVTVCADQCAELPVVDYCGCSWGTSDQKVADLSPEAWALISDRGLSAGVIWVTVHLGG